MASTRRKPGQLGLYVEGYQVWLARQGYTPQTVRNMLKDLGQVGQWMLHEGLEAAQLDARSDPADAPQGRRVPDREDLRQLA